MKRFVMFAALAALLAGATGCRVAECWRYAWNSRFHPQQQQTVIVADPCVTDCPCDPCSGGTVVTSSAPCSSCSN